MSLLNVIIIVAMVLTFAVMVMGIASMGRGGSWDRELSERFMFLRIGLQGLVILLLIGASYYAKQ